MARMDFKEIFYNQDFNRNDVVSKFDGIIRTEPGTDVTIIPYASVKSPNECFQAMYGRRVFKKIREENEISIFDLTYHPRTRNRDKTSISGRFLVFKHLELENIHLLLSIEPQEFIHRALMPFIERNFPRIFLTTLGQSNMHMMLENYREINKFDELRVARASLRSRFLWLEKAKETTIPSISWPNLGLDGAFNLALEQNGWFKSLTFESIKNSMVFAETTLNRNGIVKTDRNLLIVFNQLVKEICNLVHYQFELFRNRSRRDSELLEVRPLTIKFAKDRLGESEERSRLIETMRMYNKASVSVEHSNPYLQLSIIDYIDGSTFEMWVFNPTELVLVPQLKGTVPAIRRVIRHVFDNYAEGQIEEFSAIN